MVEKPPYTITPDILSRVERIGEMIGRAETDYEFEFIHPFDDGNGRMGRLWQTLILTRWKALFAYIPVESLVHARQADYYEAIRQSSAQGESTKFIAFMLEIIIEALWIPTASDQDTDQVSDQVARLLAALRKGPKTAAELMAELGLSHRPTFRKNYIRPAISAGLVEMTRPESPTARNQKYRLTAPGREPGAPAERESARRLAELGGSQPDLQSTPRRRPWKFEV